MTKKLKVDDITSQLEGSAFFPRKPAEREMEEESDEASIVQRTASPTGTPSRSRARQQASKHASSDDGVPVDVVEVIRRIVKTPGKEVAYVRLTVEEKDQLGDIVYAYKRQRKKTSENEIARIAVSFILEDYKANGDASVLTRVIDAMRA
jgi:hypothetical protein